MITAEAWTRVIINSQCSSIKWIERSTKYVLPRIQVFIMYVRKPRRVFRLLTSDFQLPTSDLRLHTSNFRLQTWQSANSGFLISDRSDFRTSHLPLLTSEFRANAHGQSHSTPVDSPANSVASYPLTRYAHAIKKRRVSVTGLLHSRSSCRHATLLPQNGCWSWPLHLYCRTL